MENYNLKLLRHYIFIDPNNVHCDINEHSLLNNIKSTIREDIEPHSGDFDVKNLELSSLVSKSSEYYQQMSSKNQDLENLAEEIAKEAGIKPEDAQSAYFDYMDDDRNYLDMLDKL